MTQRKIVRIVVPELQRRFLFFVLLCGGTSVVLSVCLTALSLNRMARALPSDGGLVMESIPGVLGMTLFVALAVSLPAFGLLAAIASMPFFGVFFRLRSFLEGTAAGTQIKPCRLRDKDPLKDVCDVLNLVTEERRQANAELLEEDPASISDAA